MNVGSRLKIVFIVTVLLSLVTGCDKRIDSKHPNIIIIIADDLGWADVGYNGAEFYETPNIDQLAAEGMSFNRFYPGAANCAPSRATLLTGMYTPRHQVYIPQGLARGGEVSKMRFKVPTEGQDSTYNTFPVSNNNVKPEFESLAEMLKKSGYISARLGKWHIGDDNQGFDVLSAAGTPGEITNINGTEKRYYDDIYVAERLTDLALDFIDQSQNKPFFLYLSHWEVHAPMAARPDRIEYYNKKLAGWENKEINPVYAAEVEQVDLSVGRVLKKLKDTGLEKITIVIFTSDNGGVSDYTSNLPLRAGKGTFYEGGIRTPFCIRWPGVIKAGSVTDTPVNSVDLMPTFAEITTAPSPESQPVDGISLLPILQGKPLDTKRPVYFHFPLYLGGSKKDKVLPSYDGEQHYWRAVPSSTLISGEWKLIYYDEYENYELFNIKKDISEQKNLAKEKPDIAVDLLKKMTKWREEVKAPVPSVENE